MVLIVGAVAGQVDEHQVLGAGALGEGAHGAADALPSGQRAVGQVIAMVDQADHATGAEALAEHVGHVVDLAKEHALLAIAADG